MGRSDSKLEAREAEEQLIEILEQAIDKKIKFEHQVGIYDDYYPTEIYNINDPGWCRELPQYITCNDEEFDFDVYWLDPDWENMFNELISQKLEYLEGEIERAEKSLNNYKERLNHFKNLKFSDINF